MSTNPYQPPQELGTESDVARSASYYDGDRGVMWLLLSFNGRIPRSTFWGASIAMALYSCIIWAALFLVAHETAAAAILTLAIFAMSILAIWISLAIQVKRWHDRDKPGVWILIGFVPIVGPIWQFIETGFLPGTIGDNQYGPDPLQR